MKRALRALYLPGIVLVSLAAIVITVFSLGQMIHGSDSNYKSQGTSMSANVDAASTFYARELPKNPPKFSYQATKTHLLLIFDMELKPENTLNVTGYTYNWYGNYPTNLWKEPYLFPNTCFQEALGMIRSHINSTDNNIKTDLFWVKLGLRDGVWRVTSIQPRHKRELRLMPSEVVCE